MAQPDGETVVVTGAGAPAGSPAPVRRDDRWATMQMTLDKYGNQIRCRVVAGNLRRTEDRWRACNQMRQYWAVTPAARKRLRLPDTVRRTLVVRSLPSRLAAGARAKRAHIY